MRLHRNAYPPSRFIPLEAWPMTDILDLLDRGLLGDWLPLIAALRKDPHGDFALRVERSLRQTYLYGTSALFLTLLARLREETEDPNTFPKPPELIP